MNHTSVHGQRRKSLRTSNLKVRRKIILCSNHMLGFLRIRISQKVSRDEKYKQLFKLDSDNFKRERFFFSYCTTKWEVLCTWQKWVLALRIAFLSSPGAIQGTGPFTATQWCKDLLTPSFNSARCEPDSIIHLPPMETASSPRRWWFLHSYQFLKLTPSFSLFRHSPLYL